MHWDWGARGATYFIMIPVTLKHQFLAVDADVDMRNCIGENPYPSESLVTKGEIRAEVCGVGAERVRRRDLYGHINISTVQVQEGENIPAPY